jgi:hypothetical protein
MRLPLIAVLVAAAACAGGTSTTQTRPETMRVVAGSGTATGQFNLTATNTASVSKVPASIDRVWKLMPSVYDSLKIPLTTVDGAKHLIGNEGMKIRQRLGGAPLSRYIDCGQAQIGPSADSYDVFLAVTTTVRSLSATETEVATTVESQAKPITYAQDYSRCSTKGTLETTISDIIAKKLAAASK